jgi:hypothetical protein
MAINDNEGVADCLSALSCSVYFSRVFQLGISADPAPAHNIGKKAVKKNAPARKDAGFEDCWAFLSDDITRSQRRMA